MSSSHLSELQSRYTALRRQLADVGYLSQGSVYRRPAGQSGNRFTWSTKVNAKTISLALSEDQADWLEKAIQEHRRIKKILADMHLLSRQIMRAQFPDTERRKPINKKVLRLILAPFRPDPLGMAVPAVSPGPITTNRVRSICGSHTTVPISTATMSGLTASPSILATAGLSFPGSGQAVFMEKCFNFDCSLVTSILLFHVPDACFCDPPQRVSPV